MAIETLRAGDWIVTKDQHDAAGQLVLRQIEETFHRTAQHLLFLTIRSSTGQTQTLTTTNEHPVYVEGLGWIKALDLEPGHNLLEPDGGTSTVIATRHETHREGISVYNFRVNEAHTYFVREEGSTTEPVWVHNAYHAMGNPALRGVAENYSKRAQELWKRLPERGRYGATVSVSAKNGVEVVSLYGNIGAKGRTFAQNEIDDFLKSVRNDGGIAIHTSGTVHSEVALRQRFKGISAIGISNPNGPCPNCLGTYFEPAKFFNLAWPDR